MLGPLGLRLLEVSESVCLVYLWHSVTQYYSVNDSQLFVHTHTHTHTHTHIHTWGFPGGANGKEPTGQCKRLKRWESIPGLGRSSGGGLSNPIQYSCLGNPMDREAWWATVHRVAKRQT